MNEKIPTMDHAEVWKRLVTRSLCPDDATYERFLHRIKEGLLTRDENPASHFCTYFLPMNLKTKQVFLVHHKKAELWLSPGGHLDKGEKPEQAVNREIEEELGVKDFFGQTPKPFFFSIVDINHEKLACKTHHDLWYGMETNGSNFVVDPVEFHETRWMTIPEARDIVTDTSNLQALERVEKIFDQAGFPPSRE